MGIPLPLQSESNNLTHDGKGRVLAPPTNAIAPTEHPEGNWFGDERTAYITIMRGCNYNCSYCIVPQVRGKESYRPMPEILTEIKNRVAEGKKEVMLLGQTVNSYWWKPTPDASSNQDFADLLRAVNEIEGVEMIRFMSPHPKHMRERVIEAIRDCKKVSRHLHLPLQSGSERVLHAMKR
jgi:tRNA-2-methylthio-N6-dimethylallyladenosine synthase